MNLLSKRLLIVVLSAAATALTGCAAQRLHDEGMAAIAGGNYEDGISKLQQATRKDPGNLAWRLDLRSRHEAAVQNLIAAADAANLAGNPDQAETEYRRVLVLEPSNDRAQRGLVNLRADRRHAERIAHAEAALAAKQIDAADQEVRSVLNEDPAYAPAHALADKIEQARGPLAVVPKLHTRDNRPVTLQFRDAPTKMVFEVLARETGLNFIFDKEVKTEGKTTIFVTQVPVEQAIDLILAQNQLARQVLSENMVLVYPNTPAKQKDYQDEIVHTFYLANATPKEAESMLKTVIGAKTMHIDERSNVLILRDTPEHVHMAQKLIAAMDEPDAEVIMEVEVLEITHTLADQLGINYPSKIALTPSGGTSSSTSTGTSTGSGLVLADIAKQNSRTLTVSSLSVSADFLKTRGDTNVLSSPRIRARNKEKAKIMVGDRVPVITSGVSATTGGSFSTSSVQYLEVGLTLDVQPTIHNDGNVAIKVNLEVSSIANTVSVPTGGGGTTQAYQISTRNASTLLELRDGETQVLAGLIQNSDSRSTSSLPGLGDLPILGRLFGSTGNNRSKSEIVLSITPRIIRSPGRASSEDSEFWYGSESQTRTAPFVSPSSAPAGTAPAGTNSGSAPRPAAAPASGGVSYGAGAANPGLPQSPPPSSAPRAAPERIEAAAAAPPPPPAEAAAPSAADPGSSPSAPAIGGPATGTLAAATTPVKMAADDVPPPPPPPPPAKPSVTLEGPDSAKVGDEIKVSVKLSPSQALGRIRAQVRFDATALQLIGAEPGDLAPAGDAAKPVMRPGGVQIELAGSDSGGISGGGSIVDMRFRVVAPRPALSIDTQVVLVGEDGVAIAATAATPLKIAVSQ